MPLKPRQQRKAQKAVVWILDSLNRENISRSPMYVKAALLRELARIQPPPAPAAPESRSDSPHP